MTARRWNAAADEPEMYGPRPMELGDLPLFSSGEVARDQVLDAFEVHRSAVVEALRAEAWRLWRELGRALSANDVRHVLARFPGVDARILVTAFRGWRVVGSTTHDAPGNHARKISLFIPKERPDE